MKRNGAQRIIEGICCTLRAAFGLLLTAAVIASPFWLTEDSPEQLLERAAQLYRSFRASESTAISGGVVAGEVVTPTEVTVTAPPATTTTTAAPTTTTSTEGLLPVREVQYLKGNVSGSGINVKNGNSNHSIDIAAQLAKQPDFRLSSEGYQVLIIHTHTTECYTGNGSGFYNPKVSPRTTDKSQNIVRVGDEVEQELDAAGIKVLHVTTVHDYPAYNGSYGRAQDTINEYLKKYPTIQMVIDIHRDAMTQNDGTKLKPTAVINGRKAAQVMIISGCNDDGSLYFPDWEYNLRMAVRLQKQLCEDWPGLARPLYFAPFRYNMHLTRNSLLIEFGTDANSLDEAIYSGELFGKSLAKLLKSL
ncbi:MAG: stage II sporulation protein P [Ruminococcaceae bacterium]|nr:stage II sporulation protein P [Oscillospiraceae bacterium]